MMALSNSPEKELALLLATGQGANIQVIEALITEYGAEIEQLIRALTDDGGSPTGAAQDLIPPILSYAIRHAGLIDRKDSVRAWLFSAAVQFWVTNNRRNPGAGTLSRWMAAAKPARSVRWPADHPELKDTISDQYLEHLPDSLRPTILLRYRFGLPTALISQIQDIPERIILQNLNQFRTPFLPPPKSNRRHPERAARKLQADIQAAFDQSPDQHADPALDNHIKVCDDCQEFRDALTNLEQGIQARLGDRWPERPLPEPTIRKLSSQALALLEGRGKHSEKRWPFRELAGIVMLGAVVLLVFRYLTPAVVDYTPTPTPAILPSANLSAAGTPAVLELPETAYGLSKTLIGAGATIVNRIEFSPDGDLLVSGSQDNLVRVWGGPDESNLVILRGHTSEVTSLGFSPDGMFLATGDAQGIIRIWNPLGRFLYSTLDNSPGPIRDLTFSPDGNLLAVSTEKSMWLWVVNKQAFVRVFEYPGRDINSVSFSPFGDILAMSDDNTVYLRRVRDGQLLLKYENHTGPVSQVAFSPDGNWLASGARDRTVILAQINPVSDGQLRAEIIYTLAVGSEVTDIAFSRDSTLLAVATQGGDISLFFSSDGVRAQEIPSGGQYITFSPSDSTMASIGSDGQIRIWESGVPKDNDRSQ